MRDDGAEDTGPVASHEGHKELGALGVGLARGSEDVLVKCADGLLEGHELHDGVGDLTAPERHDTLVEGVPAFSLHHLWPGTAEGSREGSLVAGLNAHFGL